MAWRGWVVVAGQAADDGLAGDGAVFVVVAEVGVEVVRQPVLGVVARAAGGAICRPRRQVRSSATWSLGSMRLRGSLGAMMSRAAAAAASFLCAAVILSCAAGISQVSWRPG